MYISACKGSSHTCCCGSCFNCWSVFSTAAKAKALIRGTDIQRLEMSVSCRTAACFDRQQGCMEGAVCFG